MNRKINEIKRKGKLRELSVLLIFIAGVFSAVSCKEEPPPRAKEETAAEEEAAPKKEPHLKGQVVLRSSLAGSWYPGDAETLKKQIDGFLEGAEVEPIEDVIGLILPHAGYSYSGQTAASAIKMIDKEYKRIVIIGPSHRVAMEQILSVPKVTHYETPLGKVPLDLEFIDELLKFAEFENLPQVHKYEHSVQIEVPLLQYSRGDFKLVPIVAGSCSQETIDKVSDILSGLIDEETLVIASSDFVHYGPNHRYVPFTEHIPQQIKELDMGAFEYIAELDSKGFLEYKRTTGATICGYVPIAILLSMMDRPARAHLIKYATSGEMMGDFTNSVSYLSVAFTGRWEKQPQIKPEHNNPGLTAEDKKALLALARESIVYVLKHKQIPTVPELGFTNSVAMRQVRGAFVTLNKAPKGSGPQRPQLRGCIGDIFPQRPLYRAVIVNAINAAFKDRRFYPVAEEELDDITIEISALTRPESVTSPNDIKIGVDGVVLRKNSRSAVYLPQVATEQDWDLDTMLGQLSLKAGLSEDAWKEGASFEVFQAEVFGESQR